jgi:hypothetical protein
MRLVTTALLLGVAGLVASSTIDFAQARDQGQRDWYQDHGGKPGMGPAVPGSAVWGYERGMCWKHHNSQRQQGEWVPCSQIGRRKRP